MVGRLLGDAVAVQANLLPDRLQTNLFSVMVSLQLTRASKLVGHLVLHAIDVLPVHLHLFVHAALEIGDLLQVSFTSLNLDLQGSCGAASLIKLALFEVEILLHLFDLVDAGKRSLSVQVLVHMLEQGCNRLLRVSHVSLHLLLVRLVLLRKVIDLLLFRVEHFELLLSTHATASSAFWPIAHLVLDVLDVAIVGVDHFAQVANFLILLLNLGIVLLNAIHKTLASLGEGQIVLITLKLEIVLSLL